MLTEKDLLDKLEGIVQLKDVPGNFPIYDYITERQRNGIHKRTEVVFIFDWTMGQYSYYHPKGLPGRTIYLSINTPLIQHKDGYRIAPEATRGVTEVK